MYAPSALSSQLLDMKSAASKFSLPVSKSNAPQIPTRAVLP